MKQYSHSFRTFNEAHEQITKTYAKALEVLRYCRTIHCYKVEWRSLLTVDMYETEDNDPEEAYRKALQKLPTKHERSVRAIDQLIVDAKKSLSDLRTDVPPLVPFIETYVRPELGDFLPTGDQYFFDFFDRIFADVESWALKCQKLYRSRKLDSRIRDQCEKLGKSFPLSLELEDQVRARLFEEEGRLVRLLKDSKGVFEDEGKPETICKADQVDECFRLAKEVVDILFDIRCHQQDDGIFGGVRHDRKAEMIPIRFLEADKLTLARQKLRFVAGEYRKAYAAVEVDYENCLGRKKLFQPPVEERSHFASYYFLLHIADPLVLRWAKKYEFYLRLVPDDPESSRSCGKAIGKLNEKYPFDLEQEVAFRERLSFEKSELHHCLATWNRSEIAPIAESKGKRRKSKGTNKEPFDRTLFDWLKLYHEYGSKKKFHNRPVGCRKFETWINEHPGRDSHKTNATAVSRFFTAAFQSHAKYKLLCGEDGNETDVRALEMKFELLNGDTTNEGLRRLVETRISDRHKEAELDVD